MIDEFTLALLWAAWLSLSTMPLGFMLGASCSPCCGNACGDNKPVTDPENEGKWTPSGNWKTGVSWAFTANPGDSSGEEWYFYGSAATSKPGGGATTSERTDWGNLCNWYSAILQSIGPSTSIGAQSSRLTKRASRLPPSGAIVHVFTDVSTSTVGPQTVKAAYFWAGRLISGSELTTTNAAHGTTHGAVFIGSGVDGSIVNGGALFIRSESLNASVVNDGAEFLGGTNGQDCIVNDGAVFDAIGGLGSINVGTVNGGATFESLCSNAILFPTTVQAVVNGGAVFNGNSNNSSSIVNGGATFGGTSQNRRNRFDSNGNPIPGLVNDGAVFNDSSRNGEDSVVNDGAIFNGSSFNEEFATVNGGAEFNDSSYNASEVNGGATFNDNSVNVSSFYSIINGGGTFNGNSKNGEFATVNGGATFNDAACSERTVGNFFATPCNRKFVAHPTDLPTCNGTAPDGCDNAADTCGCG